MNVFFSLTRHFMIYSCAVVLCTINALPLYAAEAPVAQKKPTAQPRPTARPKIQPRQNTSHLTDFEPSAPRVARTDSAPAKKGTTAPQKNTAKTGSPTTPQNAPNDKLKGTLDVFAKDCIVRMNRQRKPGIMQKEVTRQSDGSFLARYLAVDPDSLETSYNPTAGNKTIPYIGRMDYHEVEYVSVGKSQQQALAGPFNEVNRSPITELVKYKQGKWTY